MAVEKQVFNYVAKDVNGNLLEGKIKAFNEADIREDFIKRGITPLDIEETNVFSRDLSLGKKKIKPKEVASFARQFSTMQGAAVPIVKSLEVLADQSSNPSMREVIKSMVQDIESGGTLADSLEKHPKVFSPIVVNMTRAGERGGFLDKTLISIAESLEADVKLKAKIKSAMTYPVVIGVMALLMCAGMLLFIVPIFDNMFSSLGGELPVPTQILVNLSNFLKVGAIPIAIVIAAAIIWWNKNKHKRAIREFVDPLKLKVPVFGSLTKKLIMARFARNFSALLDANVPIIPVIDIVGTTTGSTVLEKSLWEVRDSILAGGKISAPMYKDPLFPKMLVEMTSIGEDAGDMPMMLNKVADAYDDEVETMTDSLTSLLEPIMLVFLGGIVGSMIVALYLPIFSVYDLIK
jgi:type IV pilus assembly protein PilC